MVNFIAVVKSNISLFSKCIFFQLIFFIYIMSPAGAEDQKMLALHETSRKIEMSCGTTTMSLVCGYNDEKDTIQDTRVCSHSELTFKDKKGKIFKPLFPKNLENYWSPEAIACAKSKVDKNFYALVIFSSPHSDRNCGAQCHINAVYNLNGKAFRDDLPFERVLLDYGIGDVPYLDVETIR